MASSSSAAGPSTDTSPTATGRSALSTGKFKGDVRVWYNTERILNGEEWIYDKSLKSAIERMGSGRSWKGKVGFPGTVACFGSERYPWRFIGIEVGTELTVADVIVICVWSVKAHDGYAAWLDTQQRNGFTNLTGIILKCQEDYQQRVKSVLITGGYETKAMGRSLVMQRANTACGRARQGEPDPAPTAEEQPEDQAPSGSSSEERFKFRYYVQYGYSVVGRAKTKMGRSKSFSFSDIRRGWKNMGRRSPDLG